MAATLSSSLGSSSIGSFPQPEFTLNVAIEEPILHCINKKIRVGVDTRTFVEERIPKILEEIEKEINEQMIDKKKDRLFESKSFHVFVKGQGFVKYFYEQTLSHENYNIKLVAGVEVYVLSPFKNLAISTNSTNSNFHYLETAVYSSYRNLLDILNQDVCTELEFCDPQSKSVRCQLQYTPLNKRLPLYPRRMYKFSQFPKPSISHTQEVMPSLMAIATQFPGWPIEERVNFIRMFANSVVSFGLLKEDVSILKNRHTQLIRPPRNFLRGILDRIYDQTPTSSLFNSSSSSSSSNVNQKLLPKAAIRSSSSSVEYQSPEEFQSADIVGIVVHPSSGTPKTILAPKETTIFTLNKGFLETIRSYLGIADFFVFSSTCRQHYRELNSILTTAVKIRPFWQLIREATEWRGINQGPEGNVIGYFYDLYHMVFPLIKRMQDAKNGKDYELLYKLTLQLNILIKAFKIEGLITLYIARLKSAQNKNNSETEAMEAVNAIKGKIESIVNKNIERNPRPQDWQSQINKLCPLLIDPNKTIFEAVNFLIKKFSTLLTLKLKVKSKKRIFDYAIELPCRQNTKMTEIYTLTKKTLVKDYKIRDEFVLCPDFGSVEHTKETFALLPDGMTLMQYAWLINQPAQAIFMECVLKDVIKSK